MSSLTSTVLLVAETIRNQRAILLPVAYNHFKTKQEMITMRNASWLLRQLEESLDHHLSSLCKHRKYGTVLYRTGGDLLNALSRALGYAACNSDDQNTPAVPTDPSKTVELEEAVTLVGEEMNKNLHQLASQLMTKPFDYRTIDINKLTESANPQLWKLITLMTASKSRGHVQRQKE